MDDLLKTKICSRCQQKKSIDEFYLRRRAKDGHDSQCKDCHNTPTHAVELPHDLSTVVKICSRCEEKKALTEFFRNRTANDGHMAYCKACFNIAEGRPERVEKRTAYKAAYHIEHATEINARTLQWQKDNPEKFAAKTRRYYFKHHEERLAYHAWYRSTNRVLTRLRIQKSKRKNPSYYALKRKLYRLSHMDQFAEYAQQRRAREMAIPILEKVVLSVLWKRDKGLCGICHKRISSIKEASRDHIIPVTKPGSEHSYRNAVLAHKWCNSWKGNREIPNQQFRLF
jgi:HNH endonuclease